MRVVTPENITFDFRLAGPFRRFPAFLLDMLVVSITVTAITITIMILVPSMAGMGVALVAWFFLSWGYGGFCETVFNGRTIGKRAAGLRVVTPRGLPITPAQAIIRNFLRFADLAFFFPLAIGLSFLIGNRFQRLGDLAADTVVVVEETLRLDGVRKVKDARISDLAAMLPASFLPDRALSEALSSYIARRELLVPARRIEIADHLAQPLIARFDLSKSIDPDLLLCALYQRVYQR